MFKRGRIILILLIGLYLATRLANLSLLPVFNDETLYIFLAKQLLVNPAQNLFVSFQDGKEPFFFWLLAISLKVFPEPLVAARILSVLSGLVGLGYLYLVSRRLFSNTTAIIVSTIYISSPLLLFYHRLGLLDSLLVSSLTATLYYLHVALTKNSARASTLLGLSIGISLLIKTSAPLFLASMLPLAVHQYYNNPQTKKTSLYLIYTVMVAALIYSIVLFQPQFSAIAAKNQTFIYSLSEMKSGGFGPFIVNIKQSLRWLLGYEGWPIFLVSLCGVGVLILRRKYQVLPWLIMLAFPIVAESAIAKIFFPRYLLFTIIPLLIILGFIIEDLRKSLSRHLRYLIPILTIVVFLPNIFLSSQIIFQPERARLPAIERWQYLDGWPSGYGVKETAEYLSVIKAQKVISENIVAVSIGIPNYMTFPQTTFETGRFDPSIPQLPEKYMAESFNGAHFVFTQIQLIPPSWPLQLEKTFPRGENGERISIYRRL